MSTVSNDVAHSSCLKPIASPDWLPASSCWKRYSLTSYGLEMKIAYRRTTIQLVERLGLCTRKRHSDTTKRPSRLLRNVGYGVRCRVTSGYDWTDICQSWGEGERQVLRRCLAVLAGAFSNQACRRTLFIHKIICCLRQKLVILCSVISQGKVVALVRWEMKPSFDDAKTDY